MSFTRSAVTRIATRCSRPRAVGESQQRAWVSQLSAFDAALQANSANAPLPPRYNPQLNAARDQSLTRSPVASTSSSLPPSIAHTSLAPAASPTAAAAAGAGPVALPDPAAVDPDTELLSYLARLIMRDGKLARAHSALDSMLAQLHLATASPPLPVLRKALEVVSPQIRMVGRRKGTKVMQTPQPLTDKQRTRQAWKWIVDASDKRVGDKEFDFGRRLALEVLAVLNGQSEANKSLVGRHQQGVTGRANVGR
ncbi:hypothetical protein BMF94_1606 [Rhodotorula taiwanensis]|uniref:Small ribosomal subunit protein uS7 domain-containing protein n=1 Tax=Rhodotorula taiwanensis TaxID=741276 RepID=A0A2S5BEM9_9BASI|nr:hypothetical protein BMF94_1606 [Rhodotorula taiwanensis]